MRNFILVLVLLNFLAFAYQSWILEPENKVDALSGATLTSRGVANLLRFWMGEMGYKTFLENLRSGEA